jgi:hypothetical protein
MKIHLILPNFVKYCKILSGTGKDQKILLNLALLHRKLSLNVSWAQCYKTFFVRNLRIFVIS